MESPSRFESQAPELHVEIHKHGLGQQAMASGPLASTSTKVAPYERPALSNVYIFPEAKYPDMEKVVYEWFLQHQERVNITGELILEKANEALKLLHLVNPSEHHLSQGWLEKFKSRHGIKSYRRFGESGSIDTHDMEKKLEEGKDQSISNERCF
ncbi:hypothetical protein ACS0TY_005554 [Phlomoides rotata]